MRTFLGIISAAILFLALCCHLKAQATNAQDAFAQTVSSHKAGIDDCLNNLSKKGGSKEERGAAAFSTSFLLDSYDQFARGADKATQQTLAGDAELMGKLCSLHIAYAEYQLEEAKIEANPPAVSALEKAFKQYQSACACLRELRDRETIAREGKRIEEGLTRTIAGLNKYAEWFSRDAFMNPDGKKWEANPAAQAEKLREEIATGTSSASELAICEKALERIMNDIQKATERKDGATALEKMILGARWLTTILQKSPEAFVKNFRNFNIVTRPAMEEARKGYLPEKMREFSRFYEPLKSHYLALTSEKK